MATKGRVLKSLIADRKEEVESAAMNSSMARVGIFTWTVLMKPIAYEITIAALLHDIGKFAQRARRPYSKEMQGSYLPSFKGVSGHWHALYTDFGHGLSIYRLT